MKIWYHFFNRNKVLQGVFLLLFLGGGIYWLLTDFVVSEPEWSPFSLLFFPVAQTSSLFFKILTITVLCATLILWQLFFKKNNFLESTSYYPSVFYLLILLLSGVYAKSLVSLFFLFILLLILFINVDYRLPVIKGSVFLSGILIGILSFFNILAVLLLFFLISSLITHRYGKAKDILVTFFGFLLPVIYFLSYYFLTDQFGKIVEACSHLSFFGFARSLTTLTAFQLTKLILLILTLIYFLIWLRLQYASKLIILRRRLNSIDAMTIVLLCMFLLSNSNYMELQLYMALPFTVYFTLATQEQRRWVFHDILIITTFLLLWL